MVERPSACQDSHLTGKPGASQGSPLRVDPRGPTGYGRPRASTDDIAVNNYTVWGALPHAATADICDTVKKVTVENVSALRSRPWRSGARGTRVCSTKKYRTCTLGLTSEMPLMEYGHPDSSCSLATISTSELLLLEHSHPGTSLTMWSLVVSWR